MPCHSAEIPYVFHSQDNVRGAFWSEQERELSTYIMNQWSEFVYGNGACLAHAPFVLLLDPLALSHTVAEPSDWPRFRASNNITLIYDLPTVYQDATYRQSFCDFWDRMGYIY